MWKLQQRPFHRAEAMGLSAREAVKGNEQDTRGCGRVAAPWRPFCFPRHPAPWLRNPSGDHHVLTERDDSLLAGIYCCMTYDFTYLSLGAGVQSTALVIMSVLGLHGCPQANAAIFADTQDEPAWVYRHLTLLAAWAADRGPPVHITTKGCPSRDVGGPPDGQGQTVRRHPRSNGQPRAPTCPTHQVFGPPRLTKRSLAGSKPGGASCCVSRTGSVRSPRRRWSSSVQGGSSWWVFGRGRKFGTSVRARRRAAAISAPGTECV